MRYIFCTLMLFFSAPSFAQAAPDPNQFVTLAFQVTDMIDKGQSGSIWDSSSLVMKAATKRDQFVAITEQRRKQQAKITNRQWESVLLQSVASGVQGVPSGRYMTVILIGTNSAGQGVKEQVSFSLDSDNMWRVVGYTVAG
jgi:Protein of unknown function (DUF4019)